MTLPGGFELVVAWRFLREGRMQSLLIVVGVAAGVAVVAYISALVGGLQQNTLDKTLGAQAHVVLSEREDAVLPSAAAASAVAGSTALVQAMPRAQRLRSVANWPALVPLLEALPEVAAVSPMVAGSGLALRGQAQRAVALAGVELARYDRIVGLSGRVVAGEARLGPGEAIVGRELAADLGLGVGDRLTLAAGSGADAAQDTARITALVDFGVRELNRRSVVVPLREAQSLLGLPGGATRIELALHDVWAAPALSARLAREWPYLVESWQDSNASLVSALNAQSLSTAVIRAVVLVVVVLGIASVLVVSVVQKQREIGILRAMGATQGQVMRVFLLQGALVGVAGSLLGVVLAAGLVKAFTVFARGGDGLPLFTITLPPGLALQVAVVATLCGLLAAVAPARRAARLDPAQAMRL
jgi:lipoprotein-releasing system permease protein